MKIKRYKRVQHVLGFFKNNFGLQPPYCVLLDATFCGAALEVKVKISEQIPKYLGAETKLVTTQCIILEVEKMSKISSKLRGAWIVVKQFPVHKCGHESSPVPAFSCIKSLLKKRNPAKYIVASQDNELRQRIHKYVTGAPILYLHRSAPTLEYPTEKSQAMAKKSLKMLTAHEKKTLKCLKRQYIGNDDEPPPQKKKKPKNPNPLSCKKSKKIKESQQQNVVEIKGMRKRHRKKKERVELA
ncbi:hypothetical protein OTU49_008332 [Cherax quadricarinatus]|uniref:rRNA-processing protein UTP23 homolog n=1 Tax=Cherax quadricarinatus TaxID=27406 RepID=A0AAW0WPG5_CHEQU